MIPLSSSKYYNWCSRLGLPNNHNGIIPKSIWTLDWEEKTVISYALAHPGEGYRRLTYMMIDENIVALSPSPVYWFSGKWNFQNLN